MIYQSGFLTLLAADKRKVYRIGASFSSETGTIADWEVR